MHLRPLLHRSVRFAAASAALALGPAVANAAGPKSPGPRPAVPSAISNLKSEIALPPTLADLPPQAREVFDFTLAQNEREWDPAAALLGTPARDGKPGRHGIRQSSLYVPALLFRDAPGDRERAAAVIDAILAQQINAPGQPYHGTFYRRAQDPRLQPGAKMWKDYDPNWRQFVGMSWAIALLRDAEKLPAETREKLLRSLILALEGEIGERRLHPGYTNIALMHAFVAQVAGRLADRPDLFAEGQRYVREIEADFARLGTFDEYNSPTYYGVDLHALAFWRALGPDPDMRRVGAALEAALWRDTAAFYHADLLNLCGPYDRAYGMDMTRYVSLTGVLLRMTLPPGTPVPHPELARRLAHGHDLNFALIYARVPTLIPADALPHFTAFSGTRTLRRTLTHDRIATAWLSPELMIGGLGSGKLREAYGADSQYRPATLHWKHPAGGVAWASVLEIKDADAIAAPRRLTVKARDGLVVRLLCPGADPAAQRADAWTLPGLTTRITTDAKTFTATTDGDHLVLRYPGATRFNLTVK